LAGFDDELLRTARRLLSRSTGQRGRLPGATIRRSISTTYYALFHFLVDDAGRFLIGSESKYGHRRRVLGRAFTHAGMRLAFEKVRGTVVDASVADLIRPTGSKAADVASPDFARQMATAFLEAQSQRHDADYDLNKGLSALDAHRVANEVEAAISTWISRPSSDDDFKHSLCLLMLLKGQLKREN
jgi:uncharacterized protein (UPF0332 family)